MLPLVLLSLHLAPLSPLFTRLPLLLFARTRHWPHDQWRKNTFYFEVSLEFLVFVQLTELFFTTKFFYLDHIRVKYLF